MTRDDALKLWFAYERFACKIAVGVAKQLALPEGMLDDLKQTALMALWKSATLYDPSRGVRFATYSKVYIMRCVFNSLKKAFTFRTKRGKIVGTEFSAHRVPLHDNSQIDNREDSDPFDAACRGDAFDDLIRDIPVQWQHYVRRYFVDGLTYQEIADEAGLSKQRVAQIVGRSVAKIRECRKNDMGAGR